MREVIRFLVRNQGNKICQHYLQFVCLPTLNPLATFFSIKQSKSYFQRLNSYNCEVESVFSPSSRLSNIYTDIPRRSGHLHQTHLIVTQLKRHCTNVAIIHNLATIAELLDVVHCLDNIVPVNLVTWVSSVEDGEQIINFEQSSIEFFSFLTNSEDLDRYLVVEVTQHAPH